MIRTVIVQAHWNALAAPGFAQARWRTEMAPRARLIFMTMFFAGVVTTARK